MTREAHRNPVEALVIINRRRNPGLISSFWSWVKDNPGIAITILGAGVITQYIAWRLFLCGALSQGELQAQGQTPYRVTSNDMLQLGRAMIGEVTESSVSWANPMTQNAGAAVLHALGNHYMLVPGKRELYPTLGQFVQAYCQPLSPLWSDPGAGRCLESPARCTTAHISRRQRIQSTAWSALPMIVRNMVNQYVRGCLPNPIGRRTDWAAAGYGYNPPDASNVGGNVFGSHRSARAVEVRFA